MRNFRNFRILDTFGVQTSSVELVSRTSYKSNHKNNLFYHLRILKQSKLVEARAHIVVSGILYVSCESAEKQTCSAFAFSVAHCL